MSDILNINQCNLAQTIGESNRFLFHVMLVHIATCVIEGKKSFFSEDLFRTLIITAMAITMYHVLFRKIIEPKIEKMKLICYNDKKRRSKKKRISKQTLFDGSTTDTGSQSKQDTTTDNETDNTKIDTEEDTENETDNTKIDTEEDTEDDTEDNTENDNKNKSKSDHRYKKQTIIAKNGNTPRDYSKRQQILRNRPDSR